MRLPRKPEGNLPNILSDIEWNSALFVIISLPSLTCAISTTNSIEEPVFDHSIILSQTSAPHLSERHGLTWTRLRCGRLYRSYFVVKLVFTNIGHSFVSG